MFRCFFNLFFIVAIELDEGLFRLDVHGWRVMRLLWGQVTGGGVGSSVSGCVLVGLDGVGSWLISLARSAGLTVLGAIGAVTLLSGAVNTVGAVGAVARRQFTGLGGDFDSVPGLLGVVVGVALHGDVLLEVLVSDHAHSEELII